ncbi:MAG: metallophosphoesterase family protein [Rhodobacteraceae bacterium]|nr:metallophosphoesterase family protein [Paracoccaceae bacterium]
MNCAHLGVIDGPIVVFGGPYSNFQATQALLQQVPIGATLICTGDVVAYCGQPAETVSAIRTAGVHVVSGNCEIQLAAGEADCGCGFEEGSTCDALSAAWFGFADTQIDQDARRWMQQCPDILTFDHAGARYGVIHGGVSDVARFIWPSSPDTVFAEEWALLENAAGPVDHVIAGHSGIPFEKRCAAGMWLNAGVIGMPPHDGAQETRFAVIEEGAYRLERLTYDVNKAVSAMRAAGLTQGYHTGLETGYWPSEDVLPSDLRVPSLARG